MPKPIEWTDHYLDEADHKIRTAAELKIPGLQTFGYLKMKSIRSSPPTHFHRSAYEIVFVLSGKLLLYCGEKEHTLYGGDIFFTFPNEIHGTESIPYTPSEIIWMQVCTETISDFLYLSSDAADDMKRHLRNIEAPLIHTDSKEIITEAKKLAKLVFSQEVSVSKYALANKISHLLYLLIAQCIEPNRRISEEIQNICFFIDKNICNDITLDELAGRAGMSLSWFKHRFKREVGLPPANYILRLKIKNICEELSSGASFSELAVKYGFCSSSHFTYVFKKYVGMTPRDFLRIEENK